MRVRRLSDTSVTVLAATSLHLVLEASAGLFGGRGVGAGSGGGGVQSQQGSLTSSSLSPGAYLERLAAGRMALLKRAVGYCARGVHVREGDMLSVSFEGVPHSFRVGKIEPPAPIPSGGRRKTGTMERVQEAGGGVDDSLVKPLAALSISEPPLAAQSPPSKAVPMASSSSVTGAAAEGEDASSTAAPPPPPPPRVGKTDESSSTEESKGSDAVAAAGAAAATTRVRLEAFYRAHNPEKLVSGNIDGILAKYAGREETLFAKLEKQYRTGSSLLRTTTAGGNTGTERQRQEHQHQQPASVATPRSAAELYAFSPARGQPPLPTNGVEMKHAGELHSPAMPSPKRRNAENVSGSGAAGGEEATRIRSWGASESLWFIAADTPIQLSGADAHPPRSDTAPTTVIDSHTIGGSPAERERSGRGSSQPEGSESGKRIGGDGDWGSVGGLSSQIQQLREAIELPLRSPEVLQRYGVRPPRGVLLHGPPGTGKTTLARAAAKACGCHVIVVNGSELMSRWGSGLVYMQKHEKKKLEL